MKKFLSLLLCLTLTIGVSAFTACGDKTEDSSNMTSEVPTYIVTFKQYNQTDIEKEVEEGKALTDIPTPKDRTGYTVTWDKTAADLANITKDVTVTAVETPNEYTITYAAGEGLTSPTPQKVTYDQPFTLAVPEEREEYNFLGWTYNNAAVVSADKWTIASDVTLTAVWQAKEMFEVTFIQGGKEIKSVKVEKGGNLDGAAIPSPEAKTGYNVSWNYTADQLVDIQESFIIYAKEDPKEYTVYLKASENGTVTQSSFVILYDADYDLSAYAQANAGYEFVRWERNGEPFATYGSWTLDETNIELTAIFSVKKASKVTLNVNGGNPNSLTTFTYEFEYGKEYTLPTPAHKDEDYEFEGWRLNSADGTEIPLSGTWKYDMAEVTLYATWGVGWTKPY